jgi:hypothetical protein
VIDSIYILHNIFKLRGTIMKRSGLLIAAWRAVKPWTARMCDSFLAMQGAFPISEKARKTDG